jgi:hypothetical protein
VSYLGKSKKVISTFLFQIIFALMKKYFLITISTLCLLFSCKKDTPLHRLIHESDVVRVYIFSGNQIAVKYFTNDLDKIKAWNNYIAEDSLPAAPCDYEGRLVFKVYEDSTVMRFSLKNSCQRVTYTLKGIQYNQSLTADGLAYLESLKMIE